jgi:hypothetical protein
LVSEQASLLSRAGNSAESTNSQRGNTHGWVHVFEEMTLPVVMAELSTIADFLDYRKARTRPSTLDNQELAAAIARLETAMGCAWRNSYRSPEARGKDRTPG